jgi:DNA polymerase III epsilon subunit-like protein
MKKFELYVVDVESTGLTKQHSIIEISLYRISNNEQKTWFIKPLNFENIEPDALRVNGHKLEDLKGLTKFGKDTYMEATKVSAEIENWVMDDLHSSDERLLVGHNILGFDKDMLISFWKNCNTIDTFPFSKKFALDTMQIQILLDILSDNYCEYYNLNSLVERYGIKKEKSHRSASDTRMTKDVFLKQFECLKK